MHKNYNKILLKVSIFITIKILPEKATHKFDVIKLKRTID